MFSLSHILPTHLSRLLTTALVLCAHLTLAQKNDSITHHYDSLAKIKLSELDSSNNRFNNKVDSLQLRLNNILNPNFSKLSSKFKRKKLAPSDTIQATHELDSMKRGVTHKIDSLKSLNLPTDRYTRKLDSLNQIGPQKYIEMANNKIQSVEGKVNKPIDDINNKINKPVDQLEDKINKPVDNVENKINDKLNTMRQEGGENANIPGNINTKDLSLGKTDLSLDKTNLPNANGLPGTDLKTDINGVDNPLSKIDNPLGNQTGQLGELEDKATDLKNIPQEQINKVTSIDELQSAKGKLGDVNKATDKIQSYQGDVKNIANGDLSEVKSIPEAIEKKASGLDEIKDLQKQTGEMTKAKGELDKLKGANDPEAMKAMAQTEIKKQAIDHFKGKEQVLQQAMDKVSKLKDKYPELSSLKDIPKRPPNPMKGKPLIERLVPGVTLQVQKMHNVMVDVNPVLSYRFTGRINAGLGWNERFAFTKWNKLSLPDRIYGPRVFGSFAFKKGFAVKAEIEKMNTIIPPSPISPDGTRQWVWSAFVGMKKDYTFIGRVRGNMQILYNLYDDHYNSPYADRLNVRMGFEFPMKKHKKPVK